MNWAIIASIALMIFGAAAEAQASMTVSSAQPFEPGCTTATDSDSTNGPPNTNATFSLSSATSASTTITPSRVTGTASDSPGLERGRAGRARSWVEAIRRMGVWQKAQQVQRTGSQKSEAGSLKRALDRLERHYTSNRMRRREVACSCGSWRLHTPSIFSA
jgi:hypothetical protein